MTDERPDDRRDESEAAAGNNTRRELLRLGTMAFLTAGLLRSGLKAAVTASGTCGQPAGGGLYFEDTTCSPTNNPGSDDDCTKQGPSGSYQDNACAAGGNDMDCGTLRAEGQIHSDDDCSQFTQDDDCGMLVGGDDVRAAPDSDCYAGGPEGMHDNDCGKIQSANGHRYSDEDCCNPSGSGGPSLDTRCGLQRPNLAFYEDNCCGVPYGTPQVHTDDADCGKLKAANTATSHEDSACNLASPSGLPYEDENGDG